MKGVGMGRGKHHRHSFTCYGQDAMDQIWAYMRRGAASRSSSSNVVAGSIPSAPPSLEGDGRKMHHGASTSPKWCYVGCGLHAWCLLSQSKPEGSRAETLAFHLKQYSVWGDRPDTVMMGDPLVTAAHALSQPPRLYCSS